MALRLNELSKVGVAEAFHNKSESLIWDWKNLLVWRGTRWSIGSQAFAWWVRDVIITQAIPLQSLDTWLAHKKYRLLITEEQWQSIKETWKEMPSWAVSGVGGLARSLWKSIVAQKG